MATDSAPAGTARFSTVPINVTVVDRNDNQPRFLEHEYSVSVVDNIPHYPDPSAIAQVVATDADAGVNAELRFSLVFGNDEGLFRLDESSGVIYPNRSFLGLSGRQFDLTVEVTDEAGAAVWPNPDRARVSVSVDSVNTHKPEWFPQPPQDQTIRLREETAMRDVVILKVNARDRDHGENARISYFLKVGNRNVGEAEEHFSMSEATGELRARGTFDREVRKRYELVLVARDHGTPVAFETLRFVTVVVTDVNDNAPMFPPEESSGADGIARFTVPEEEEPGFLVGRVRAEDADEAGVSDGRIYYYIVEGNEERWFSIDKTYGNIYTKKKIDREKVTLKFQFIKKIPIYFGVSFLYYFFYCKTDHFDLVVKASNDADLLCDGSTCDVEVTEQDFKDRAAIRVQIYVEDKNDNLPK